MLGADDSSESDGASEPLSAAFVAGASEFHSELRNSLNSAESSEGFETFLRNGPGFIRQGYPIPVIEQCVMIDI